jgi:hypothetical protein
MPQLHSVQSFDGSGQVASIARDTPTGRPRRANPAKVFLDGASVELVSEKTRVPARQGPRRYSAVAFVFKRLTQANHMVRWHETTLCWLIRPSRDLVRKKSFRGPKNVMKIVWL